MDSHDHFVRWCLVITLYALFLVVAVALGWPAYIFSLDKTSVSGVICTIIGIVFGAMSLWCGMLSWQVDGALKAQESRALEIAKHEAEGSLSQAPPPIGFGATIDRLTNASAHGWFAIASCQMLGLIGTVIGFIIMLTGFKDFTVGDSAATQMMISEMASGMGAAYVTTIVGMIASLLIGLQYHMLDRAVGRLRR